MGLRKKLMSDLASQKAKLRGGQESIGIEGSGRFETKALRSQKGLIARKELADFNRATEDTVNALLKEANITDQLQASKFRSGLKKKLNQLQTVAIQQAGAARSQMVQKQLSAESQQQFNQLLGQTFGNVASMAISGFGVAPQQQQQQQSAQSIAPRVDDSDAVADLNRRVGIKVQEGPQEQQFTLPELKQL